MFLKERSLLSEQLDNFNLSGKELERTLRELRRINRLFGNIRTVQDALWRELDTPQDTLTTIVDIGCGGGDLLGAIGKAAQKEGRQLELIGIDGNAASLAFAQQTWSQLPRLRFLQADILAPEFQIPNCDYLISSHFLYHFPDDKLPAFLQKQLKQVGRAAIFSELDRNFLALQLFKFVSLLLGYSKMTRADGQTAVRRAFRQEELRQLIQKTPFTHYRLAYKWAFRHLLTIYCSHDDLSD